MLSTGLQLSPLIPACSQCYLLVVFDFCKSLPVSRSLSLQVTSGICFPLVVCTAPQSSLLDQSGLCKSLLVSSSLCRSPAASTGLSRCPVYFSGLCRSPVVFCGLCWFPAVFAGLQWSLSVSTGLQCSPVLSSCICWSLLVACGL